MYYFIVNPNSRSGRGLNLWNQLEKYLEKEHVEYQAFLTERPGHASELSSHLTSSKLTSPDSPVIVAVGGDGTLNEVINGFHVGSGASLAYIRCGSGNDFARGMKMPSSPIKALKGILSRSHETYIDYGILCYMTDHPTHRRFLVSSGIGFDADVCKEMLSSKIKRWCNKVHVGKLSYVFIGIKRILLCKSTNGYLQIDQTTKIPLRKIRFLSFHIQRYEGGGFCFAPSADPSDGLLEICCVSGISKFGLIRVLAASLFKKHPSACGVHMYQCREAKLHVERPLQVHTDGEVCFEQTDISLQCERGKIHLIW